MAIWLVPAIVGGLILVIIIYAIVRMGREDDQMEAGGSWGEQLTEKTDKQD